MQDHQTGEVIVPLAGDQIRPIDSVSPVETTKPIPAPSIPVEPATSAQLDSLPIQSASLQEALAPAYDPAPPPQAPSPAQPPYETVSDPKQTEVTTLAPADFTGDTLNWEAEEFIHNTKSSQWYSLSVVAALVVAVVVFFINRDIITAAIVFLAIIGLAFFSGRQPRVQQYSLNAQGIQAGNKWYDFTDFQGFSIVTDGPAARSILLIPMKRFIPLVTINLPPDQEGAAADILESVLPMQQRQGDPVDRLMRRLKF